MSKYFNKKIRVDGVWYDSKAEYARWIDLVNQQNNGEIQNLQRQVTFILAPAVVLKGRKKPALKYKADFAYTKNGIPVVEDKKGCVTDAYMIKKHLMKSVHNIEILET